MMNQNGTSNQENAGASVRTNHTLALDRRRHAAITGVTDVCSFHENEIVLKLDSGLMILTGDGLHIARLLLEEGKLDIDGHVDSIVYEALKKPVRQLLPWKWHKK